MIKIFNVCSLNSALYGVVDFCKTHVHDEIEIIVPDKLSLFMEKFLFEQMNITASFNLQVSTLNRFAKKSCVVDKSKQISKIGSILLIHKILNDNIQNLEILRNKAYSFSYAEDIFATIGQLKASKISVDEMKSFKSTDERLNAKIKDLSLVYEEYEKGKAGLLDMADWFLMSTLTVSNGQENKKILFVGFDDFTAIQYSIIERLAVVCEVSVFNYASRSQNKHIFNGEIFEQLRNIALINQLPFEVENLQTSTTELKTFLQSNLFALNNEQFTLNNEVVKVYAGNNLKEEIEFVAREIRSKILAGKRFDNFGVAVYNLESNTQKIKEIFSKYEINHYLDCEISVNKSVLYKFFQSVIKYNLEGYRLSNLVDIINSPFFEFEESKKRALIEQLLKLNFRGIINPQTNLNLEEADKDYLIKKLNLLVINKDLTSSKIVENFNKIFELFNMQTKLEELSKDEIENLVLINKSKETIFNLFDEIVKFNGEIDLNSFYDVFSHASSVLKINNLPLSLDAVKIIDATNITEIFEELYIVNATHENAPSLKYDCGIILDSEIEKLNFKNKLSPTISHINKLMKLRLFNNITMFDCELTLTYSNSQSEVIKELLNRLKVNTQKGEMKILPITKFEHGKIIVLSKMDYIEKTCKLQKNNKNHEKITENSEKIIKNKDFYNISSKNLKIYEDFHTVSASTLESYFKCPFYAFLNNILKIQPRLNSEILSLDIGNVLHEILQVYYIKKKNVGGIYEFCKNMVFKCVEKEERLKLNANSPILINLIDEAVRVINAVNYIDYNSAFVPTYFELSFNKEEALKLKNISIIGKVDRIDVLNNMFRIVDYKSGRADAGLKELYYGNKLQLFLYSCAMENVLKKSGVGSFYLPLHNAYTKDDKNPYSMKGFYLAEDFVVREFDKRLQAGGKSDIVNVRLNKDGGVIKSQGYKELESAEMLNLKNYSKVVSEQAVDEIKSGFILPSPSEVSKPCEYCPYVHICLKESNDIHFRPSNTVKLESFKEAKHERV